MRVCPRLPRSQASQRLQLPLRLPRVRLPASCCPATHLPRRSTSSVTHPCLVTHSALGRPRLRALTMGHSLQHIRNSMMRGCMERSGAPLAGFLVPKLCIQCSSSARVAATELTVPAFDPGLAPAGLRVLTALELSRKYTHDLLLFRHFTVQPAGQCLGHF